MIPVPLGIGPTSPSASAPWRTASAAASGVVMQQTLTRVRNAARLFPRRRGRDCQPMRAPLSLHRRLEHNGSRRMSNLVVVDHPLVQHKLTLMRMKQTPVAEFRRLVREVALLIGYEITRDLPLTTTEIETPLKPMRAPLLAGKKVCLISILRAGNGLLDGMLDLMPSARVGHIGLYRDPATLQPVEYYYKVPVDIAERPVIVVDPMLATAQLGGGRGRPAQARRRRRTSSSPACWRRPRASRASTQAHPDVHGLHGRARRAAERSRLHPAGPRRCRRPDLRHALSGCVNPA